MTRNLRPVFFFYHSLCGVKPRQKTGFRYQNGRKLGLNIFLLSPKKMLSGLLPLFIFLTLWCVSSYILLVDKGRRYVTKWRPKWKWNRAGFTLNSTLSSIYLRWALILEFPHTGNDWNHRFVFENIWSENAYYKKEGKKMETHDLAPRWQAAVNVPTFKGDLMPKQNVSSWNQVYSPPAWLAWFWQARTEANDVLWGCQSW